MKKQLFRKTDELYKEVTGSAYVCRYPAAWLGSTKDEGISSVVVCHLGCEFAPSPLQWDEALG